MFNQERKHFKNKLKGIQTMMWDWEFKKFKLELLREEKRQEFDGLKSRLNVLEAQINSEKESPTMEAGDIARLDDAKELLLLDIQRAQEAMDGVDSEINGLPATAENPSGVSGINQQIDALNDLEAIVKLYLRNL